MAKPIKILTKSAAWTKKIGERLAKDMLRPFFAEATKGKLKTATVLSLEGELGAGKTTFTQGFARGLGIKENPRSPTFVLMRIYAIRHKPYAISNKSRGVRHKAYGLRQQLIHIDAYRIMSKDLKHLGWKELVKNKQNIILIEWGNRVKNILPKNAVRVIFKHIGHLNERLIKIIAPQ